MRFGEINAEGRPIDGRVALRMNKARRKHCLRLASFFTISCLYACRCTLIVLAERKEVGGAATYDNDRGVALTTAANRRNPPQCLDSAIHHNNLLNNILVSLGENGTPFLSIRSS